MSAADKMAVIGASEFLPPREELPIFTILVCGGRDFSNKLAVWWELDKFGDLNSQERLRIIEGGCPTGADAFAREWRDEHDCWWDTYKPDWRTHGHAAGPIRNRRMIEEGKPNLVLAFPGGRGTADMIRQARAAGIEVREVLL